MYLPVFDMILGVLFLMYCNLRKLTLKVNYSNPTDYQEEHWPQVQKYHQ